MLRRMLARLEKTMGPLREWLKILWMDRGYWGRICFANSKQDYGIDFVSRVRDEKLDLNGAIQRQLEEADRPWTSFEEERQFSGRKEMQKVRVTALTADHFDQRRTSAHRQIAVNIVVAHQCHPTALRFGTRREGYFPDRLRHQPGAGRYGVKVRGFYRAAGESRIRDFAGCRRPGHRPSGRAQLRGGSGAAGVRVHDLQRAPLVRKQSRHRPDYAEQLRQMRSYGPGISLAGAANVVLTASGFCCTFTARELLKLHKQRLQKAIQRGLVAGRSIEEIMRNSTAANCNWGEGASLLPCGNFRFVSHGGGAAD